jgi:6-phosphogluconate dehydrogenase
VLALSLFSRFASRQDDSFRDRVIAALRAQFGGHAVKHRSETDGAVASEGNPIAPAGSGAHPERPRRSAH